MSMPIRVAQVMGKMLGGGVEAVVMNYYQNIDRDRIQFDFLVDADSEIVPNEEIASLGGRVIETPPYQHLHEYSRKLESLFCEERWPIVHSHLNALSVFPLRAAKRACVPIRIAHSHSTSGKGEYVKNAMKRILRTQANHYPTHCIACSQYAGDWLFGKDSEYTVLHNAIDLDLFSFNSASRKYLSLNDEQFVICHAGRFATQKNHLFLLKAFSELLDRIPNAVLLLAGNGELRMQAESWVHKHGLSESIRFLGQRTDMDRLYQAADVFVLPSLYEGLGLVAVEAQASGLPCILADSITREVNLTGHVQFLPTDNPTIWADAISSIASSRKTNEERIELCKRDRINGCFDSYDISKEALKLADLYEMFYRELF